jgi:hypothetical protein
MGDDVSVKGAISFDVENGRSSALLASGSEITARSGKLRIDLDNGDVIAVCAPAHFSILKAGDTITIALDYGEVHPELSSAVALTIYTPLIVATPVAIGQDPRDLTIGLDQTGSLCAVTARGALRIEEQLTGQGLLVPQGGQVSFNGSELNTVRNASEPCSCELLVVSDTAAKQIEMNLPFHPPVPQPVTSASAPASAPPPPLPSGSPIYRISVPLTFDASSPPAPAILAPPVILLDQEARLEPQIDFLGDVEPAPPPPPAKPAASEAKTKKPGLFTRLLHIFHWRHGSTHCAGAGCDTSALWPDSFPPPARPAGEQYSTRRQAAASVSTTTHIDNLGNEW